MISSWMDVDYILECEIKNLPSPSVVWYRQNNHSICFIFRSIFPLEDGGSRKEITESRFSHSNITWTLCFNFLHISWLLCKKQHIHKEEEYAACLWLFTVFKQFVTAQSRVASSDNVGGKIGACVVVTPSGEWGKFVLQQRNPSGGPISVALAFSLWIKASYSRHWAHSDW